MIGRENFKNAANNIVREPSVKVYLGEELPEWVVCSVSKDSKNFNGKPFGNAVPQELQVIVQGDVNLPKDTEINIQYFFGAIASGFVYPAFYVQECSFNAETKQTTITAKDKLQSLLDKQYDAKTDGTLSAVGFLDRFCDTFGFEYEITGGVLTDAVMPQNPNFSEDDNALTVLAKFAEMLCCNAFIRNKNTLCLASVRTNADASLNIEYGVTKFRKDAIANPINRVVLSRGDLNDNEYRPADEEFKEPEVFEYTVVNNPFLDNNDSLDSRGNYIDALYTYIEGEVYTGYSLTFNGNPCLECGDVIAVREDTKNGTVYHKVIFYGDTLTFDNKMSSSVTIAYTPSTVSYSSKKGSIGKAIREANIKVDKIEGEIDLIVSETNVNSADIASIQANTQSISASVESMKKNIEDSTTEMGAEISTLRSKVEAAITSEDVQIQIQTSLENGIDKVETTTGYKFDDTGLTVSKTGSEMTTQITENGMTVSRRGEDVLIANNAGVEATNLHAKTYLIIGSNSRFEDYVLNGEPRTGCFWIGG